MTEPDERAIPDRVHDAAGQWLARRQGGISPNVEREFGAWLAVDPSHHQAYDLAARHWRDSMMLADSEVGRTRKLPRAPFFMRHSAHVGVAGVGLAAILGFLTPHMDAAQGCRDLDLAWRGSNVTFSGESDLVQAIRESNRQNVSRAGDQITPATFRSS